MSTQLQSPEQELDALQTRLMRMLDSVRLEKVELPPLQSPPTPRESGCPHCASTQPWGQSSWCPACGYYPKLGRAVSAVETEQAKPDLPVVAEDDDTDWAGLLVLGVLVLLGESFVARWCHSDPAERGFWALVQLFGGTALFLVAHVRAYAIAAQNTDAVSLTCFLFDPVKIWSPVVKQLPRTRATIWAGCWGLLAAGLALFVIGLDWDGLCRGARPKTKFNPMKAVMRAASATAGSTAFTSGDEENLESSAAEDPTEWNDPGGIVGPPAPSATSIEDSLNNFADDAGGYALDSAARGQTESGAPDRPKRDRRQPSRDGLPDKQIVDPAATTSTPRRGSTVSESDSNRQESDGQPTAALQGSDSQQVVDPESSDASREQSAGDSRNGSKEQDSNSESSAASRGATPAPTAPLKDPKASAGEQQQEEQSDLIAFGYLTNASGEIRSVLLAEVKEGRGRFVCKLTLERADQELGNRLQQALDQVPSSRAALPSPYLARWVRPVVRCRIAHPGWTKDGQIREGHLVEFERLEEGSDQSSQTGSAATK